MAGSLKDLSSNLVKGLSQDFNLNRGLEFKLSWTWLLVGAGLFALIPSSVGLAAYENDEVKSDETNKNFMKTWVAFSVIAFVVGIIMLIVLYAQEGKKLISSGL